MEVIKLSQGLPQHRRQSAVQFHRHHTPGPLAQFPGEGADAGAHLQHAGIFIDAGSLGNGCGHMPGTEEILPQAFGKMKPMTGQYLFDGADITQIQMGSPF